MTEQYVIQSHGYARGIPGGADGQYLEFYRPGANPDTDEMGGFTPDPQKAMKFASIAEAWAKWREPRVDAAGAPIHRYDGELDRPLTVFTISVIPLGEAHFNPPDTTGLPPHIKDAILRGVGMSSMAKAIYGDPDDSEEDDPDDRYEDHSDEVAEAFNSDDDR